MWKEIRFALFATKKNIESNAELRTSFLANIFGMIVNNSAFVVIWVYFTKMVGDINGWSPADIVGLLGFVTISYGIIFCLGGGIVKLPEYTFSGAFDRFMLAPKNLLLRVATSVFRPSAVGDIIFGLACIVIYYFLIDAGPSHILFIIFLSVTASMATLALVISAYSASFLFADSRTITEGLFHFAISPSLFHGGAFQGLLRFFFIFAVPSLLLGALPVEATRDLSLGKLLLTFIVSAAWLALSIKLFYAGVRKYESTNFMTFGN